MSSSNIVVLVKYQNCKNLKQSVSKTISYISDKKKADSLSIDKNNLLNDYILYSLDNEYLEESEESFVWSINGDIDAKKQLKKLEDLDQTGRLWSLVISFQPDFAVNKGLITKNDYYQLTKNVIPPFLTNCGFDLNNTIWYCSLHRNTDNPHLHINFFEKKKYNKNSKLPASSIYKLKSSIANYLIGNEKFYILRDQNFKDIIGDINLKKLTQIHKQQLFSDKYRRDLNSMLLNLYNKLPDKGRLQYNSKNIKPYKSELDSIIEFILMHDSVKYNYSKYLKLLEEHQKELNSVYGMSKSNEKSDYYNKQLNKLYSKIGNEILDNFKIYNSADLMLKEKNFMKKNINQFNFKSRNDYKKEETILEIAKGLYKICTLSELTYNQTKKVFEKWIKNSSYNSIDIDSLLSTFTTIDTRMSKEQYYSYLRKLGYNYDRYIKIKNKNFYRELNYKKFIHKSFNYLMYEIESEQKQIERQMEYELDMV